MRSFDWSTKILSMLVESLAYEHSTPYSVKGCTLLPLYWLCEHAEVIEVREDLEDPSRMIPRLVKWHLPKLKDFELGKITTEKVDVNDLDPTECEKSWFNKMKKWNAHVGVDNDVSDSMDYFGKSNDTEESDGMSAHAVEKKYLELLKEHDDLKIMFEVVKEENKRLKDEKEIMTEKVSSLSATVQELLDDREGFVYVQTNVKRKRDDVSSSGVERRNFTPTSFLALLDKEEKYKGHFGHILEADCLAAFVSIYNNGDGATVYHTAIPLVVVTVDQVLAIFEGAYVCNSVIDAYGAQLLKGYKGERNITIISADCWSRIVKDGSKLLLEQIKGATSLDKAMLLFPVLSSGGDSDTRQNHWSLCVFDVQGKEWKFYNSKRPKINTKEDKYLEDANKMKVIIENFLKVPEAPLRLVTVPQQSSTSNCAIFLCYFMKHVVTGLKLGKNINSTLKKFKAEIVQALVSSHLKNL